VSHFLDIAEVNARLRPRFAELVLQLVNAEPTLRTRDELRFGRKGSLSAMIAGPKVGSWHDYESGERGDPVALVAYQRRCSMKEAREWAIGWLGEAVHQPAPRPEARAAASQVSPNAGRARALWEEAVSAAGTLVEAYLRSRNLSLPANAPLRFHPSCPRGQGRDAERLPAMLALMTDPSTGQARGIHRTYLRPDGSGKATGDAKKMLGNAGVIRLTPDADADGVVTTGDLAVAEGIETSLAVMQRLGRPVVWAATSSAGIRNLPVVLRFSSLTVYADADMAGIAAARVACDRWSARGIPARLKAPGSGDWDDATKPPGSGA
jgi:hypothetical protein